MAALLACFIVQNRTTQSVITRIEYFMHTYRAVAHH